VLKRKRCMSCEVWRDDTTTSDTGHVSPDWVLQGRVKCWLSWKGSDLTLEQSGAVLEYDAIVWLDWDADVQPHAQDERQDQLRDFEDAAGRDMEVPEMMVLRLVRNSGPRRLFSRAYCKARGA